MYAAFTRCTVSRPSCPDIKCEIPVAIAADKIFSISKAQTVVIYCQGNNGMVHDKKTYQRTVHLMKQFRCPVVTFDYPGRGMYAHTHGITNQTDQRVTSLLERSIRSLAFLGPNEVLPDEEWLVASARAVCSKILNEYPQILNVIVWGKSLGSVASCSLVSWLASAFPRKCKGHVIESGIASALHCAFENTSCMANKDHLDNVKTITQHGIWPCQVLIFHGDKDSEVSLYNSSLLEEAFRQHPLARVKRVVLKGKDHDDILISELNSEVERWLREMIILDHFQQPTMGTSSVLAACYSFATAKMTS